MYKFYNVSSVYCIVCSPRMKSPSNIVYPLFTLSYLPPPTSSFSFLPFGSSFLCNISSQGSFALWLSLELFFLHILFHSPFQLDPLTSPHRPEDCGPSWVICEGAAVAAGAKPCLRAWNAFPVWLVGAGGRWEGHKFHPSTHMYTPGTYLTACKMGPLPLWATSGL